MLLKSLTRWLGGMIVTVILLSLWPGSGVDLETQESLGSAAGSFDFLDQIFSAEYLWSHSKAMFFSLRLAGMALLVFMVLVNIAVLVYPFLSNAIKNYCVKILKVISIWPSIVLAPVLVYLFSLQLKIFPVALYENGWSLVLPIVVLVLRPFSQTMLMWDLYVGEIADSGFALYAKAKGLSSIQIYFQHLQKMAINRLTTFIPLQVVHLFYGAWLVEVLFSLPGIGSKLFEAVLTRDRALVFLLVSASSLVYFITEVLLTKISLRLDPRLQDAG